MRRKMPRGGRGALQDSGASAAFAEPRGCLAPVLPQLSGADVTTGHEGPNALAAEPVTRFLPPPRSEGFARKFKALIRHGSRAGLPAEPAPAGPSKPPLLLLEWQCLREVRQRPLLREVNES